MKLNGYNVLPSEDERINTFNLNFKLGQTLVTHIGKVLTVSFKSSGTNLRYDNVDSEFRGRKSINLCTRDD